MKHVKTIITDNREVYYVRMCWEKEQPPTKIYRMELIHDSLRRIGDSIKTQLIPAFDDVRKSSAMLLQAIDKLKKVKPKWHAPHNRP